MEKRVMGQVPQHRRLGSVEQVLPTYKSTQIELAFNRGKSAAGISSTDYKEVPTAEVMSPTRKKGTLEPLN